LFREARRKTARQHERQVEKVPIPGDRFVREELTDPFGTRAVALATSWPSSEQLLLSPSCEIAAVVAIAGVS
jgi:hypothetical protein